MVIRKLFADCDGGIITTELVLVASFVTATLMAGLSSLKTNVQSEFTNLSSTIQSVSATNQLPPQSSQSQPVKIETDYIRGTEYAGEIDAWMQQ